MIIFRLAPKEFTTSLYSSGVAGRWNSEGNRVIYSAESVALSTLEVMIRKGGVGVGLKYSFMYILVPDFIDIMEETEESLRLIPNWRDPIRFHASQEIGDKWYREKRTCLLKVPSALIPDSYNYILNQQHEDFEKITIQKTIPFSPDARIEQLLLG